MQSESGAIPESDEKNPPTPVQLSKLMSLAGDPKVVQFLLLVLVLDAVGLLGKATTYATGVC